MSKIEAKTEEEKAAATTGTEAATTGTEAATTGTEAATTGTEETAVSAAIARVVRMGLRPPPRFPANGDCMGIVGVTF